MRNVSDLLIGAAIGAALTIYWARNERSISREYRQIKSMVRQAMDKLPGRHNMMSVMDQEPV
ncbi:MAG: YtxH domain-containing protein [Syntrophomonadaceae bacterium]|nr:YtxH domain-containing protein [Syntrophomonadaceae bacterium]